MTKTYVITLVDRKKLTFKGVHDVHWTITNYFQLLFDPLPHGFFETRPWKRIVTIPMAQIMMIDRVVDE